MSQRGVSPRAAFMVGDVDDACRSTVRDAGDILAEQSQQAKTQRLQCAGEDGSAGVSATAVLLGKNGAGVLALNRGNTENDRPALVARDVVVGVAWNTRAFSGEVVFGSPPKSALADLAPFKADPG